MELEPFDGDALVHVVVADHMNEGEQTISTINLQQTDSVQEESIACATIDPPVPSSPAHSPDQRDVFSHHDDFCDLLETSDNEIVIQASSTNLNPALLSECNPDNSLSDHPSVMTDIISVPATYVRSKEDSYSFSISV